MILYLGGETTKKMKQTTILWGLIISSMLFLIFVVSLTAAAQTSFSVAVQGGSVRTQASIASTTYGDLPFDDVQFDRGVFAVKADQFTMTSSLDSDSGVEALTTVNYMPGSNLPMIFVNEELKKARVAEGDNESLCYLAAAKIKIAARGLGYESASIVDSSNVALASNSVGKGKFSFQTREETTTGNVNGTFTKSISLDGFSVRSGIWNATAEMTGYIPDYPASPAREETLCPFFKQKP